MSLTSRTSDTHSHLSRRIGKKRNSLHSVTTGSHAASPDGTKRESPFGRIQIDPDAPAPPSPYKPKSIFGL